MADVAYCTFRIECSDGKKLVQALIENNNINGDIDDIDEGGADNVSLELEDIYTGYGTDSMSSWGDDYVEFIGGCREEAYFSDDDLSILKDVCAENGIELTKVSSRWYDEFSTKMGAQVWPVPDWLMEYRKEAYKDGFAYAYTDESEDAIIANEDEEEIEGVVFDPCSDGILMLLDALETGENVFQKRCRSSIHAVSALTSP